MASVTLPAYLLIMVSHHGIMEEHFMFQTKKEAKEFIAKNDADDVKSLTIYTITNIDPVRNPNITVHWRKQ